MREHFNTLLLTPFGKLSPLGRFILAFLPTAVVLLSRPYLPQVLSQTPAAMHYPAVFFASWIGGLWPGILSTTTCSLYSLFVLRPQLLQGFSADLPGAIRSVMFFSTSIFFTLLVSGLQRALSRSQKSVRMRDDFLSLASHELKTPLTTLILHSQMRLRKLKKADTFSNAELVSSNEKDLFQLQRLNKLVDSMLDVSRIEARKTVFHAEAVDLPKLVRDITSSYLPNDRRVTLSLDHTLIVQADPALVEQILTNLLGNAVKYAGEKPIHITLRVEGSWAKLSVEDQGRGIDPKFHDLIFQKFERIESVNSVGGLGLGLFICRDLVERHGGKIQVESEVGKGAAFHVYLPIGD